MKKRLFLFFFSLSCCLLLSIKCVNAAEISLLPDSYYTVKPKLNASLQVNYDFQLGKLSPGFSKFEFLYIPSKQAYIINDQLGYYAVRWTGEKGVGNLTWSTQNPEDSYMLWTIEEISKKQYVIRNKVNSFMVWDVHNYYPNLGTPIKLEQEHPLSSSWHNAQVFSLD